MRALPDQQVVGRRLIVRILGRLGPQIDDRERRQKFLWVQVVNRAPALGEMQGRVDVRADVLVVANDVVLVAVAPALARRAALKGIVARIDRRLLPQGVRQVDNPRGAGKGDLRCPVAGQASDRSDAAPWVTFSTISALHMGESRFLGAG